MASVAMFVGRHVSTVHIALLFIICSIFLLLWTLNSQSFEDEPDFPIYSLYNKITTEIQVALSSSANRGKPRQDNCTYHSCFDVYQCSQDDTNQIKVYIYPYYHYVNEHEKDVTISLSQQYFEILEAITDSPYITEDPNDACLFVPIIDTLNEEIIDSDELSQMLNSLPYWQNGSNHILFTMLAGVEPTYQTALSAQTGRALLAGAGMSTYTYRRTFDISLPLYDPHTNAYQHKSTGASSKRHWLLISSQKSVHSHYTKTLEILAKKHSDVLHLTSCHSDGVSESPAAEDNQVVNKRCQHGSSLLFEYPHILQEGRFCLVLAVNRLAQAVLLDSMKAGCVPVIVTDLLVLPFSEVLDWKRAAVLIRAADLNDLVDYLQKMSRGKMELLQQQVKFLYNTYFSSIYQITLTTLQIINDRVFPYAAKTYEAWNESPQQNILANPLFLPRVAPKTAGFTAVILTYDRLDSLFEVILQVAKAPSLSKVLVVWNNQNKPPPPASVWPKISKPLKVVQTQENKLSNRFYPYDEIETEAVFALDDDIVMLTADEIQFAYDVWREFPERLVGFPSRVHVYNASEGKWKYESEWTNDISMVLTGAAIYHKYYSFLYTSALPGDMRAWVDERMNCEDIAINFLIANVTGAAPIKVTPRKKFKCPECRNVDISADISHMVERTECINRFAQVYGMMPLKTVEFRADPVLYKDHVHEQFKKYGDIGSL